MAWLMKHLAPISSWICPVGSTSRRSRDRSWGCLFILQTRSLLSSSVPQPKTQPQSKTLSLHSPSWPMMTTTLLGHSRLEFICSGVGATPRSSPISSPISLSTVCLLDSLQIIQLESAVFAAGTLTDKFGGMKFSLPRRCIYWNK